MPDKTSRNEVEAEEFQWWFVPSWMGLDAPCVVSTWTWAVGRATGVTFALGAYAVVGGGGRIWPLLAAIASVVAFNCLVIAARDARSDLANDPGGASHWWKTLRRDLLLIGLAGSLATLCMAILLPETAFYLSTSLSFASLTALHAMAGRLGGDTVRAWADFALLTPIPLFGQAAFLPVVIGQNAAVRSEFLNHRS